MSECRHINTNIGYDYVTCRDCGAFKADSCWGSASNMWFKNRAQAEYYKNHGCLPPESGDSMTHQWDRDGERCVKCGAKDWMGGECVNTKKRLYLSGPMSGLPDHNFPAFHAAAAELRAAGYDVVNPAEVNAHNPGDWSACMRADIKALCDCDGLALLPGWERSKGAHLELHIAHRIDIEINGLTLWLVMAPTRENAA